MVALFILEADAGSLAVASEAGTGAVTGGADVLQGFINAFTLAFLGLPLVALILVEAGGGT